MIPNRTKCNISLNVTLNERPAQSHALERMFRPPERKNIYEKNELTVEAIVSIFEVYATKHIEIIPLQLHDNLPQDLIIEYQVITFMMTENSLDRRRINMISGHIL